MGTFRAECKLRVAVELVDTGFHRPPKGGAHASQLSFRAIEPVEVRELGLRGDRR